MARVSVVIDNINTTRDLRRFLDLLDLVGIDTATNHPVSVSITGAITASIGVESVALDPDDDEDPLAAMRTVSS